MLKINSNFTKARPSHMFFNDTDIQQGTHMDKELKNKRLEEGTTDKLQFDDRSTSVTKGRKRNPEGTTETQPREILDSKRDKRADSKHIEVRREQQRVKE